MILHTHFFGPSITLNMARVQYQTRTPQLRLFVLLFAVTAAAFHPSNQLASASIPIQIAFWVLGYLVFIFGYRFILINTVRIGIARGWTKIYASGPLEMINLIMAVVMYGFARLVGIPTDDHFDLLKFVLFNVTLFEIGIFFYIVFAKRVIYPEVYEETDDPPANRPQREMFLRGSPIPVHSVEYIAAQDNGVVATSNGQDHFIARPFGLVVSELPVDLGFQIHRSLWVSRDLGLNFVNVGKKQFISLPDGRRFPVARSRQKDYRNWLALANKQKPRRASPASG